MSKLALGSQRAVVVCCSIAIKFPRLRRLRAGTGANREEARIWREGWQRRYRELCPVLARPLWGLALVMPAVQIMSDDELQAFRASGEFPDHYPHPQLDEGKLGEWGLLKCRPGGVGYPMRG